ARLVAGADLWLRAARFAERIRDAELVITGEGRIDRQSGYGKLTGAVTAVARSAGIPVLAVAGSLGEGHETLVLDGIASASEGVTLAQAMSDPLPLIERAAERLVRGGARATKRPCCSSASASGAATVPRCTSRSIRSRVRTLWPRDARTRSR